MELVAREGTFQGPVLEHGMGETAKGYPQWIARIAAHRMFVPEEERENFAQEGYEIDGEGWIDCSDWDWQITGYFVLFNNEKALMNYDQVMVATDWDGSDFTDLAGKDLNDHPVQFRTQIEEYNGKESMRVTWIDVVGASITRELSFIDDNAAKALNNKYRDLMKKKTVAAPASVSKSKATPKAKAAPKAAPKATPKAAPKAKKKEPEAPAGMTKEQAWELLLDKSGLDDDALTDAFLEACETVGPDKEESDFTNEDWGQVAEIVLAAAV